MVREIERAVETPRPCTYLEDEVASLEHRVLLDVGADEYDAMLARGWRRFGPDYFRPACAACDQCEPTRIVLADLAPTRSQRRALARTAHLEVEVGVPTIDAERLHLYRRWHATREVSREWAPSRMDARLYRLEFAFPHPCAREVSYREHGRLVGVGICDETPTAWSAVYFYFDPSCARMSLGIANVLRTCAIAKARGARWVYLGYHVARCRSLAYKAGFSPQEILVGRPADDEPPAWRTRATPLSSRPPAG